MIASPAIAVLAALLGAGPAAPARRPAPSRAGGTAPAVRRTAVFENPRGERRLRSPLAIARDARSGELVVSSFESGEVIVLDRSGATASRIGADARLVTPYGVAVDPAGRIYVSEVRTGRVKILAPGGAVVDELDLSRAAGRVVSPGRITLGEDGLLYVADLAANALLVVDGKGELVRSLGPFPYLQKGGASKDGKLVALSAYGAAVTVFDAAGAQLASFGAHGESSERTVSFPSGFAVDAKGRIWIADAFQHRLKVFSQAGEFLFNVGGPDDGKSGGYFFPVDLCFGAPGELIVLEKGAERIQTFVVGDLAGAGR